MDVWATVCVLALALVGFVRCVEAVIMWLTRDGQGVRLVPVSSGVDVDYIAWCAATRRRWRRERVYLVDMGLSPADRQQAARLGVEVVSLE